MDALNNPVLRHLSKEEAKEKTSSYQLLLSANAIFGVYPSNCFGLLVIFVTSCEQVATIMDHPVYRIKGVRSVSVSSQSTSAAKRLFESLIPKSFLYYSPTLDLSKRVHHENLRMDKKCNEHFAVNHKIFYQFCHPGILAFCKELSPVIIQGFVGSLGGNGASMTHLVSRRSMGRIGIRRFSRGLNQNGDASNHVETELILEIKTTGGNEVKHSQEATRIVSFVQVRGSMPFHWSQYPNLDWEPFCHCELKEKDQNLKALEKHFRKLKGAFGSPVAVLNLVERHGNQGRVGKTYQRLFEASEYCDQPFIWFELNSKIKKWPTDSKKLTHHPQIQENLKRIGLSSFVYESATQTVFGEPKSQKGVFRTNCIDSTDRTNVAQCLLAKTAFSEVSGESLNDQIIQLFKENGHALAICYVNSDVMGAIRLT